MRRGIVLSLILSAVTTLALRAQVREVSGVVTDSSNSETLIGATVVVEGSGVSAITDFDGRYLIKAQPGDRLSFSCLGMVPKTVTLGDVTVLNVALDVNRDLLEEVIVVAYGTTKKESFTGSAEVVKADKFKDRAVTDVSKMLDGQVAGVMVTSGSGQPGSGADLRVRGYGSINASNAPLLVVDGVPYDGDLSSINSNDIETMSVLKDASAGALYGARGANGVIMITTKSGKDTEGAIKLALNVKAGVSSRAIPPYETLDAGEYMEHIYAATYNDLVSTEGYLPSVAAGMTVSRLASRFLGTDNIYNPYTLPIDQVFDADGKVVSGAALRYSENWLDEAQRKAAFRQEYQFSANGGGSKGRYFASLGYLDEQGTLKTTGFKRYTARVGAQMSPKEWFDFGADINYAYSDSRFLGSDGSSNNTNVWYSAMMMGPIYPVYEKNPDGSDVLDGSGQRVFDYGKSRPAGAQNNKNSVATLFDDEYYGQTGTVNIRANAALKFGGFKLSTNLGADNSNTYESTNYNRVSGNAAGTGRLTKENGRMLSYTLNQLLSWNGKFGEHAVDALAGHEFYNYEFRYTLASRTGFPFDVYDDLGMGSTLADANSQTDRYAIDSWLSRVNYSYADRYYFSASFRMDASSRFMKDNRWGAFWSVGGSWRISQEPFLKDKSWINNLTLKASYGVQGNDNLGSFYAWQSLYSMNYPNANHSGAIITSVESRDITWEKNGNFNAGLEFRLFDRLSGTVEWYSRKTTDLLLETPMAISLGFPGYYDNVGSILNTGFDISLNADIISERDFHWSIGWMGSTLRNEVLKLSDKGEDIVNGVFLIREGLPINSFYLSRSAGVDPATGDQLYWAYKKDASGNMIEGSEYVTNNATAASGSKYVSGCRIPDIYGSLSSNFSWKGLDFAVLFTYSLGGKVFDNIYRSLMEPSFIGQTYHKNVLRSWSRAGEVTDVPKALTTLSTLASDRFLVDASYFAVKNISLGYTLPSALLSGAGIESLRVYLSCDSPWLFTSLKGMNPQADFSGSTSYSYTPNRTLNLGVDLKF